MFEAINPVYWWGATAVSAPIIIHLINRLRYRRIRWAAMEFLLKSQQRNRRKLILEQLLLLAVRCLLVMMMVLMVVRPTTCLDQADAGSADWPTYHVVLLDDSLSMQDVEDPRAVEAATAFQSGARLVAQLADKYSQAPNAHFMTVLKLSDLDTPELGRPVDQLGGAAPGQQLTSDEVRKLKEKMEALRCTYKPIHPLESVQKAGRYFENIKEGHKYLHLVSDYRRSDWTETNADELCQLLAEMARGSKVQVRLHDMALPRRGINPQEVPRAHPNLGITHLVARTRPRGDADSRSQGAEEPPARVVTPSIPLYVYATVRNFSDAERTGLPMTVKIDGTERVSRQLERIASGEEKVVAFDISFGTEEELGLKQITVGVEDPDRQDHLPPDNVRHTYVELRKEIPVLLIDPDHRLADPRPDSYFLAKALSGAARTGLRPESIHPRDLKTDEVRITDPRDNKETRRKIDQYAAVFLLNIAGIGEGAWDIDPAGLKVLETYVRRGGSVIFFLGPRTNVLSFNKDLYKTGQGLFPAPLVPRPDANRADAFVDEPPDENDLSAKLRFLKQGHPAFPFKGDMTKLVAEYISVNRYFRVDPSWQPPANVSTVIQLANRKPLTLYRKDALDLADSLNQTAGARYADKIKEYTTKMIDWVSIAPEAKRAQKKDLIEAVGGVLSEPALTEYWNEPGRKELREKLEKFHQVLLTGDPLVVEATLGKGKVQGHVLAFMTPAAPTPIGKGKDYTWNNWANEMPFTFVPLVLSLHDYMATLSRSATEIEMSREIGPDVEIRLDKDRYMPRVELWHQKEGDTNPVRVDLITAREEQGQLVARLRPLRGPGFYRLRLNQPGTEGNAETAYLTAKGDPEEWPLVFNVNSRVEGVLSRVAEADVQDRLVSGLQKGQLKLALDESIAFVRSRAWFTRDPLDAITAENVRNQSWADYSWVLFAFLGMLLLEQSLAVRFSHHLEGGVAQAPPQASRKPLAA